MPLKRDISDDTRIIDLTVAELLHVLSDRLTERLFGGSPPAQAVPSFHGLRATLLDTQPQGLLDTWQTAKLLGIYPRRELGPEPPPGSPESALWRRQEQALRNQVARRLQNWLDRHPELAALAVKPKGERRRYFRRMDVEAYLGRIAVPLSRRGLLRK